MSTQQTTGGPGRTPGEPGRTPGDPGRTTGAVERAARLRAFRLGAAGGWMVFKMSLRSPQDIGFYVFMGAGGLALLFLVRDAEVEGTDLLMPAVMMPSLLGALIAFNAMIGPASQIAMDREDGTLLRTKGVPHGMAGYVPLQLVQHILGILPAVALLLPAVVLFDGVMHNGATGWLRAAAYLVLGMVATMPVGIVIGSLAPTMQKVGTWGMLPLMALTATSGIFYPIEYLWSWVQTLAQCFPVYWLGIGMRSAFLPDSAAAVELHGSWQTMTGLGVLGVWAVVGCALCPWVLRRMARRQSGSQVEQAKQAALQVVR